MICWPIISCVLSSTRGLRLVAKLHCLRAKLILEGSGMEAIFDRVFIFGAKLEFHDICVHFSTFRLEITSENVHRIAYCF